MSEYGEYKDKASEKGHRKAGPGGEQPDCSLPSPSWFGVPHWAIALAVIVALPVAMLAYTASVR